MRGHLSEDEQVRWRQRTLLPRELLSVDDHLAVCPTCRRHFARSEPLAAMIQSFGYLTDALHHHPFGRNETP